MSEVVGWLSRFVNAESEFVHVVSGLVHRIPEVVDVVSGFVNGTSRCDIGVSGIVSWICIDCCCCGRACPTARQAFMGKVLHALPTRDGKDPGMVDFLASSVKQCHTVKSSTVPAGDMGGTACQNSRVCRRLRRQDLSGSSQILLQHTPIPKSTCVDRSTRCASAAGPNMLHQSLLPLFMQSWSGLN